jgi:hypothetical protein
METFYCEACETVAIAGDHDCQCCEARREFGPDERHSADCESYDGPPDGEEWSGGFAPNH